MDYGMSSERGRGWPGAGDLAGVEGGVVRRHDGLTGARRDAAMGKTHTKTRQATHTWM